MKIDNVFITACLRKDYLPRMVETLYKYTRNINFKVIVIDQTLDGIGDVPGVHLTLRPNRNLGFSKAMNEGIIHALHWNSEYITCVNDDVEFINEKWYDGIMETFNKESVKEIIAVAPESPRIPLWGYGDTEGNYVEVIPYKENFSESDYQYLLKGDFSAVRTRMPSLPKTFPSNYVGVCDAMATWCMIAKPKLYKELGLWDELFYPGSGEDYDFMGRIYSHDMRAVSTRSSWVWHWWGGSKDSRVVIDKTGLPIDPTRQWNHLSKLWPPELSEGHNMDVWGYYTNDKGERKPCQRIPEITVVEI